MTAHAQSTNNSNSPGSLEREYLSKTYRYVPELSYPTPKKNYKFKGANLHVVSLTPHARFLRSKIDHISENSKQNSKRLKPVNQGPRGHCLMKKTEGRNSRDTVPLTPLFRRLYVTGDVLSRRHFEMRRRLYSYMGPPINYPFALDCTCTWGIWGIL
jgi:hypothetical protein